MIDSQQRVSEGRDCEVWCLQVSFGIPLKILHWILLLTLFPRWWESFCPLSIVNGRGLEFDFIKGATGFPMEMQMEKLGLTYSWAFMCPAKRVIDEIGSLVLVAFKKEEGCSLTALFSAIHLTRNCMCRGMLGKNQGVWSVISCSWALREIWKP